MPPAGNSYDSVPYPSLAYSQTHPERMATAATLAGLKPPPLETARVLEIGCAMGGNLMPLAEQFPNAAFVGIDLSERQIAEAQGFARRCGLENLRFSQCNIIDIAADFGQFDYIICHSVYSHVAVEVQARILEVCKRHLTPDGIAFVSYNTLPGAMLRGMIREMTLFHSRQSPRPGEQTPQVRGILEFFSKSIDSQNNPYGALLQGELDNLRRAADPFLIHGFLEEQSPPIFFMEFVRRAAAQGLRFVGEADTRLQGGGTIPKEALETLQRMSPSPIYLEQYFDFLRNRAFRQTLLCHADRKPAYVLNPDLMANLQVAAAVRPQNSNPDFVSDLPEGFVADSGLAIAIREPIVKSALAVLGDEWPRRLPFHALRQRARARFEPAPVQASGAAANDANVLGLALLQLNNSGGTGFVELSPRPLPVAKTVSERPATTPLNRQLAAAGRPVVNFRHNTLFLGQLERQLLMCLDGQHDLAQIREVLLKPIRDGALTLQKEGATVTDPQQMAAILDESIKQQLVVFARQSLLLEQAP